MDENGWVSVYDGIVYDNQDPLLIGRVRVTVHGLIEPYSAWALPMCYPGAGPGRGLWIVPKVGSNVSVMFKQGDLDRPRYMPGVWPAPSDVPQSPTFVRDLSPSDATQVAGIQTDNWEIVMDDRAGASSLVIRDRQGGSTVRMDGVAKTVQIEGTVAVQIKSIGVVNIEALQVTINGRIVLPTAKPI